MSSRVLIVGVLVLVGVVSFAGGILVQRKYQLGVAEAVTDAIEDIANRNPNALPAPSLEDWQYPNSQSASKGSGNGLKANGVIICPQFQFSVSYTTHTWEQVLEYYARRMRFSDPATMARRLSGSRSGPPENSKNGLDSNIHIFDCYLPDGFHKERPFRSTCLIRRTASYDITTFLTRAHDEEHTHILIVYAVRND